MESERENQLKKIARGIRAGALTTSRMINPNDVLRTFRSMRDVTLGELADWDDDNINSIYEWHENAVEKDEDGNPVFDTYQFLTVEEYAFIDAELERLAEAAKKRNVRKRKKKPNKK